MSAVAAIVRKNLGMYLEAVDEWEDHTVLTFRRPGSRVKRHVLLTVAVCGMVAADLQPGCSILTEIDNARWQAALPDGAA